jgi:hypothetical protein
LSKFEGVYLYFILTIYLHPILYIYLPFLSFLFKIQPAKENGITTGAFINLAWKVDFSNNKLLTNGVAAQNNLNAINVKYGFNRVEGKNINLGTILLDLVRGQKDAVRPMRALASDPTSGIVDLNGDFLFGSAATYSSSGPIVGGIVAALFTSSIVFFMYLHYTKKNALASKV